MTHLVSLSLSQSLPMYVPDEGIEKTAIESEVRLKCKHVKEGRECERIKQRIHTLSHSYGPEGCCPQIKQIG